MERLLRTVWLTLLCLPTADSAIASPLRVIEANDLRFARLSISQGLSQTRVHNIVEDGQGFIWFGTQYGLDRYDGYTFKVFLHDPYQESSLGCVAVRALFRDHSGTIWAGCDRSVDRYDAATQTFRHFPLSGTPFSISQDHSGTMWIATNNGLYRLDPVTGQFARYGHDAADPRSLSSNDVKMIGEDHERRFWVSNGKNVEEFDRETGTVVRSIPVPASARSAVMFLIDHLGTFWVMYTSEKRESGLAVLDRDTNQLIRYPIYDQAGKAIAVGIHTAVEDATQTLWFATNGAGLLKLDREHRSVVRYRNRIGDPESLADDRVIALCADSAGNVWAGLYAMEPNFFHSTGTGFVSLLREHDNPRGMGESFITAIYKDHEKTLWIATTGALVRVDPASGQHRYYSLPGQNGGDDVIAINEDHHGDLWMGTTGAGLNRFDRKTGKYTAYRHDPNNPSSISSDVVSRIAASADGTLWLSTWDGLDHFDPASGRCVVYRYHPGRAEHLYNVTVAPDQTLWMGGSLGLYHFDPATEHFTVYSHHPREPRSLSDDVVNSVLLDHAGTVWAATENGLNRLDSLNGIFSTYNTTDGLASNALSCLLEDQSGSLWMSSNQGISAFSASSGRFQNYSAADGMPGVDLTGWDACFKDEDGRMYFGGFGGEVSFDPNRGLGRLETLPIVLTDLKVVDKTVQIGPRSILKQAIDHTSEITLTHAQDRLEMTFAALGFWNSAAIRYRFRLEGLDNDWVEAGSDRRTVSYTTLPSGTYTFRAQAQRRPREWTEPGIVLSITILPPWWATLWFRTLCGLLAAGILWMFHVFRLRQASTEIHARAEERLSERARIARELHDTLLQDFQAIVLRFHSVSRRLVSNDPNRLAMEEGLRYADKALAEGRNRIRDIRSDSKTPDELSKAFADYGNELSQLRPVTCTVKVTGQKIDIDTVVRDEVYRIGREALGNAVKHSECSRIEVELWYFASECRLKVRDNGKGIDPTVLAAGGKPGHWGIQNMRERARKIGATLDVSSLPNAGTTLELKLPLRSSRTATQLLRLSRSLGSRR
jgi:signal transduction histidine kinase/ligand-binding sensor domain-containing protein